MPYHLYPAIRLWQLGAVVVPLAIATPALAQVQNDTDTADDGAEIVVSISLTPGSISADLTPVAELFADDIASYGVSSIDELITALGPRRGSGRGRGAGRPVVLLNGRRVSSFREIRDLPPEAVRTVEIFPEELAVRYGYRPDQRVVNIILQGAYRTQSAEIKLGGLTAGGRSTIEGEVVYTRISKNGRLNIDVEVERSSLLTEAERGIVGTDAGVVSLAGIVTAPGGGEIDPALSALAGSTVTRAVAPGTPNPALGEFRAVSGMLTGDDTAPFRTLLARSTRIEANVSWSRRLSDTTDLNLNGQYLLERQTALLGLGAVALDVPAGTAGSPFAGDVVLSRLALTDQPLRRRSRTATTAFSAGLTGNLSDWNWTLTSNLGRVSDHDTTQRNIDFAPLQDAVLAGTQNAFAPDFDDALAFLPAEHSRSVIKTASGNALISGSPLTLPAGKVTTSFSAGYDGQWLDSRAERIGQTTAISDLSRQALLLTGSVDIPLTVHDEGIGSAIGKLSINANAGYNNLSDFGGLVTYGAGLRWSPVRTLELSASIIGEESAPGIGELGEAQLVTPNVAVYDFTAGRSTLVTRITGGNPFLPAEKRRDLTLSAAWEPTFAKNLTLRTEYFRNRSRNVTAAFPLLTPEIEAAFADRVARDAGGNLVTIDARPVSFSRTSGDRLRFGIDYSGQLGSQPGTRQGAARGGDPRDRVIGMIAGRSGGGRGRWNVGLAYTYRLNEEILIRPGVARLDVLNGDATGSTGGVPRHTVELEGGVFANGIGVRLNGNYQSATRVDGDPLTGTGALRFSDLATLNLRLFSDLDRREKLIAAMPFLKGTRVQLSINNIFNSIQDVRDESGAVPLAYQRGLVDPLGRTISLSIRKRF